jgi:hypothetical protein
VTGAGVAAGVRETIVEHFLLNGVQSSSHGSRQHAELMPTVQKPRATSHCAAKSSTAKYPDEFEKQKVFSVKVSITASFDADLDLTRKTINRKANRFEYTYNLRGG